MSYQLIHIPEDFSAESHEDFDPAYMRALYDEGYANAETESHG